MLAWHFTGDKLRDGSPIPPIGKWLRYEGEIVICESGLHASEHPFDALQYAPGPILHRVECRGIEDAHSDKFVCRERRIIKSMDATEMLRYFARMQALSVVHLWDAPDVVLDYLMTGDEQAAARAAALDAARNAARDAASWAAASWDAARNAARNAARDAASWAAAWDAARAAARAAAWAAPWDAARNAAWDAAWDDFRALVHECFGED